MDDAVVVGTDDNDVGGVIVLRTGEVVNMMGLYHAVAVFAANLLATNLVAIVIMFLQHLDDADAFPSAIKNLSSSVDSYTSSGMVLNVLANF